MKSNLWFPFYTADFIAKTYYLTQAQKGAYLNLLVWYYENTQPIPVGFEFQAANARTEEEKEDTKFILNQYFSQTDNVWRNSRCDEIITDIKKQREKQKENGQKGGRPKNPKETQKEPMGFKKETQPEPKSKPKETQSQSQSQSLSKDKEGSHEENLRYGLGSRRKVPPIQNAKAMAEATTPEEFMKAMGVGQ